MNQLNEFLSQPVTPGMVYMGIASVGISFLLFVFIYDRITRKDSKDSN